MQVTLLHALLQQEGKRVLLQCKGGLGRAPTVMAMYLTEAVPGLTAEAAIARVRALRGNAAIQTVRQYNAVAEYAPRVLPRS